MEMTRRRMLELLGLGGMVMIGESAAVRVAAAQGRKRLAVGTGGTGGVYYPLGGGIAALISKHVADVEATAEVTSASVDNMKLLHAGKIALALTLPDSALEATRGQLKGLGEKVGVRAIAALYANYLHVVALEGSGIRAISDLKGKRVSTGSPGSGTEIKGLRLLEAYGLTPKELGSQDRLGAAESAGALKDRKVDAFLWDGGLPTAAILDLAATPGIKIALIPHGDAVPKMTAKHGPLYFTANIPKSAYVGLDADVPVAAATNLLVAHERMDETLAYQIARLVVERAGELAAVHKAAKEITLQTAGVGSPIPFHPGAVRFYREKGLKIAAS